MTSKEWLDKSVTKLASGGISTARLDCLVLLEDATGKDRGWLLAHPEANLNDLLFKGTTLKGLNAQVARRTAHEPLAYIRNKKEFYGREFYVDHRVLEPRPESETMIELLKRHLDRPIHHSFSEGGSGEISRQARDDSTLRKGRTLAQCVMVDVGTGSGALAITAKFEFPGATVIATDIDARCVEVARKNAFDSKTDIKFYEGDLLEPLKSEKYSIAFLLANLPYVPNDHEINAAAMQEPKLAIFGGPDGLDLYRRMFKQLETFKTKPKFILTESMPPQHEALTEIAESAGFNLAQADDFIQVFSPASSEA